MLSVNAYSLSLSQELHNKTKRNHTKIIDDYKVARTYLFGYLHYDNGVVTDVYCSKNFGKEAGVGSMRIPNHTKINCEHTWPQSKFNSNIPKSFQKNDLHHLYPVVSWVNSSRSNYPFGDVKNGQLKGCSLSSRGYRSDGQNVFEVPDFHKGNAARATFYFAIRYKMKIDPIQEYYLKQWHQTDPVDADERLRNDRIQTIQGNRNPFIDQPELVDAIRDF